MIKPSQWKRRSRRGDVAGFSLFEAVIAMGVMVMFVLAGFSSITFNRVALQKNKEQAIALDFLTHYIENIKALPMSSLQAVALHQAQVPINSIYDFGDGNITIPVSNSWVSVSSPDYLALNPDLLWLQSRNPKMQVVLTPSAAMVNGTVHDIEVNVKLDWDSPLSRGSRLEVQVDMYRTVDTDLNFTWP